MKHLYVLQRYDSDGQKQTITCWHPMRGWRIVKELFYERKKNYQKLPQTGIYIGEYY